MMGTHSDAIIADAYVKGVRNFDVEKAKKAVLKNAYEKGNHIAWGRLGIMDYERLGYVPVDKYGEFVCSYFAWLQPSSQKEKAKELSNMTKKKEDKR